MINFREIDIIYNLKEIHVSHQVYSYNQCPPGPQTHRPLNIRI